MLDTLTRTTPVDRRQGPVSAPTLRVPTFGFLVFAPLVAFLLLAAIGPYVTSSPTAQDLVARLQPPSTSELAGTDSLGRDMLARIADGAGRSLWIGVTATTLAAAIGIALGGLAGLFGGWLDALITAITEVFLAVPTIVLGMTLVTILGQGIAILMTLLVASGWIAFARVTRLQVRAIRSSEFVLAAKASGASTSRIVVWHLVPNVLPVVLTLLCLQIGSVMLWEASLTYLGLGLPVDQVSLGGLVRNGQDHVFDAWWISFFPGLAIAIAVLGFMLLGEWLQRRLEPGGMSDLRGSRHRKKRARFDEDEHEQD